MKKNKKKTLNTTVIIVLYLNKSIKYLLRVFLLINYFFCYTSFSTCIDISWDKDGSILSCICEHSNLLTLWDANTRTVSHVDSGLRYYKYCSNFFAIIPL